MTEDVKWGNDLAFSVGGKMFCMPDIAPLEYRARKTSGGSGRLSFKVETSRFLEFTGRPGIIPAPDIARAQHGPRAVDLSHHAESAFSCRHERSDSPQLRTGVRDITEVEAA